MSSELLKDFAKRGFDARRLPPGSPMPENGFLIRGVFANVGEGNRLRRAVVGFGAGHTDLQVVVSLSNLSHGPPAPFYELNTDIESKKIPGAAITLNPKVAAARFVLAGNDLNKSISRAASEIADKAATHIRP